MGRNGDRRGADAQGRVGGGVGEMGNDGHHRNMWDSRS